jgi:ssDNA-binding Zn-finger/Zn-ribbon topoisomerase 1
MSSSELKKKVQIAFNTFIRQRDKNQLCISCQKPLPLKYDAGHFYSVGNYPAIRYNLDNCHAQCIHCNHHRGGNIHEYKIGLIKRIGEDRVEALTEIRNASRKYSVPELKEMLEFYKNLLKK